MKERNNNEYKSNGNWRGIREIEVNEAAVKTSNYSGASPSFVGSKNNKIK